MLTRNFFPGLVFSMAVVAYMAMMSFAQATGPVLLSVTKSGEAPVTFDRAALENLDWQVTQTFTSFTEGEQTFAGPTLASLMAYFDVEGGDVKATAVNDYSVTFPATYADQHNVVLAMEQNGAVMRLREKGPIWIIFPQNEDDVQSQEFDTEMVWQLDRLEFLD